MPFSFQLLFVFAQIEAPKIQADCEILFAQI